MSCNVANVCDLCRWCASKSSWVAVRAPLQPLNKIESDDSLRWKWRKTNEKRFPGKEKIIRGCILGSYYVYGVGLREEGVFTLEIDTGKEVLERGNQGWYRSDLWNRKALRKSFLEHFIHLKKFSFNHPIATATADNRIWIGFQKHK